MTGWIIMDLWKMVPKFTYLQSIMVRILVTFRLGL